MQLVYYPYPVPLNRYTITIMAILFEKIYLPGLCLPRNNVDLSEVRNEYERIDSIDRVSGATQESRIYLACLKFVDEYHELLNIFVATGKPGYLGLMEEETNDVAKQLEEAIYGPPPPNFFPTITQGFSFNLVNGPSWITYPANAYIHALKNDLPLFSDRQEFPLPASVPHNSNATKLASYLALSSLMTAMPRIKPLKATEILRVREKLRDDIADLYGVVSTLVDSYRQILGNNPSLLDLQNEADFLTQSQIQPLVERIRRRIENPGEIIKSEFFNFTMESPSLIWKVSANPSVENWIELASLASNKLKNGVNRYMSGNKLVKESGLSLLLKLPR